MKQYKTFVNCKDSLKIKISEVNKYIENVDSILRNPFMVTVTQTDKKNNWSVDCWREQWLLFLTEGPLGVGKTSLAQKGISQCLLDKNGKSRPFSFIAIGGSSNGSTLDNNYTYVGSTWGKSWTF